MSQDKIIILKKCILELMFAMAELSAELRSTDKKSCFAHRDWQQENFEELKKLLEEL